MKKIPTLFDRDWGGNPGFVVSDVNPLCQWVINGEGSAYRKIDGTCARFDGVLWWKRREIKKGKPVPEGFVQEQHDPETGKTFGWLCIGHDPEDRWFNEAIENTPDPKTGTYELIGPKVQGNTEGEAAHIFVHHDDASLVFEDVPRSFEELRAWFAGKNIEGLVFKHPDGRMAKIKKRDFSLRRDD